MNSSKIGSHIGSENKKKRSVPASHALQGGGFGYPKFASSRSASIFCFRGRVGGFHSVSLIPDGYMLEKQSKTIRIIQFTPSV